MAAHSPSGDMRWPEPGPLFNASVARKRAEQDSMLLSNRIRMLRAEEERTRKKIRETEKKTQEIIDIRRRNEERRFAKEAEWAIREAAEQEFRQLQNAGRNDQSNKLQEKHKHIQERNMANSEQMRYERVLHKQAIDEQRLLGEAEVAARAKRVRGALQAAVRSRARSEGAKHEIGKEVVRERMLREEDERRARLSDIDRMEREEAELIARLQQSQEQHRVAFLQLEDALRQSSQPGSVASFTPTAYSSATTPGLGSARGVASGRGPPAASPLTSSTSSAPSAPSRPPRPRGSVPVGQIPLASMMSAAPRPGSGATKRQDSGRQCATNSVRALSSCSTATSVAEGRGAGNSGQSTPCSVSARQITYTTVDGLQLDIPAEEDLDLASLLNS